MSYIGNSPTTQSFIAGTDTFSGTGSQTVFTLSRSVNSVNDILVVVNNVDQYPPNYSVSGNTLTISPAPSAGTNNVYVRYMSTTLQSITVPGGSSVNGTFQVAQSTYLATSSGDVGVGTISPDSLSNFKFIDVGSSGTNQGVVQANNGTVKTAIYANSTEGYLATRTNHNLNLQTNGTTRATIDTSGNVGVGTSSPDARFTVQSGGDAQITLKNSGGTTRAYIGTAGAIGTAPTDALRIRAETGGIVFGIAGTENARIDSSGNLLVGTTAGIWGERLLTRAANSSTTQPAFGAYSSNAGYTTALIFAQTETASGTGWQIFNGRSSGGAQRVIIYGNGNIVNTNNSYGALSDAKLKENIVDATPKLDQLNQVRVVNYNLKGEAQKHIGVVAQELEQIFPNIVEEAPDRDAEGNDLGTVTKSVKYSVFVPMLIKAIQEQQQMIETLQAKVAALEAK